LQKNCDTFEGDLQKIERQDDPTCDEKENLSPFLQSNRNRTVEVFSVSQQRGESSSSSDDTEAAEEQFSEVASLANKMGALDLQFSQNEPGSHSTDIICIKNGVSPEQDLPKQRTSSTGDCESCAVEPEDQGRDKKLQLPDKVEAMLYPYQKDGVEWLWNLHKMCMGGILADDMGLGKTMQVSAFLSGMIASKLIRRAIVVAPKTLLEHWVKELSTCGLGTRTHQYFGSSQPERRAALRRVMVSRGVLLTTYGMVLHNADELEGRDIVWTDKQEDRPEWDVMILDEGHKVKNPNTQLSKRLTQIRTGIRVIITGTPIQNNLMEFHALVDLACPGLLGDRADFKRRFERPITNGTCKAALPRERDIGAAVAAKLRSKTAPYILRREKKEVLPGKDSSGQATEGGDASAQCNEPQPQAMGRKEDLIVWLRLSSDQRRIYEAFLHSESVKQALNATGSVLAAITVLKKICDHPALLNERAAELVIRGANKQSRHSSRCEDSDSSGSDSEFHSCESDSDPEDDFDSARMQSAAQGIDSSANWEVEGKDIQALLLEAVQKRGAESSCKTQFAVSLIRQLTEEGHRTLVFSQSRIMLNILQAELSALQIRLLRIDGSVSSVSERQDLVNRFQSRSDIPVFLLTSQVGGLGLTLTAADRVIIIDPAWNPSVDNQSVDRAYRIGQQKDVVVYRLISCGTVEEKIYRKQVFKGGLSRAGMEEGEQIRYFSQQELRDLFTADAAELEASKTMAQLEGIHGEPGAAWTDLRSHLSWMGTQKTFAGVSDHSLIYSKKGSPGRGLQQPAAEAPRRLQAERRRTEGRAAGRRPDSGAWSGAGALSDMFATALRINLPDPDSGTREDLHKVTELERSLEKKRALMRGLAPASLPDGGDKLRESITRLEEELRAARVSSKEP